eukprot:Skav229379  [mRNA]  locus=scaffold584:146943:154470:- [translate_table: standard]
MRQTCGPAGAAVAVLRVLVGRTARVGARASRVVRVLRLAGEPNVMSHMAKQRKAERERRKKRGELEDDWDEADYEALENGHGKDTESRVGKKLSEMTTRRVICLILAMLLVQPLLSKETADQTPYSAVYGANKVWEAFEAKQLDNSTANSITCATMGGPEGQRWL